MGTLSDDLHILKEKILLNSSQQEKCFRQKLYRKSKHTFHVPHFFFGGGGGVIYEMWKIVAQPNRSQRTMQYNPKKK